MTIVVGYTPTPPGRAGLVAAAGVAAERNQPVVVVNSSRGDASADRRCPGLDPGSVPCAAVSTAGRWPSLIDRRSSSLRQRGWATYNAVTGVAWRSPPGRTAYDRVLEYGFVDQLRNAPPTTTDAVYDSFRSAYREQQTAGTAQHITMFTRCCFSR